HQRAHKQHTTVPDMRTAGVPPRRYSLPLCKGSTAYTIGEAVAGDMPMMAMQVRTPHTAASAALSFDFMAVTPLDEPPQPPPASLLQSSLHRAHFLDGPVTPRAGGGCPRSLARLAAA